METVIRPLRIGRHASLRLHGESLPELGGAPEIRDDGLLESALARPRDNLEYGEQDIHELAAVDAGGFVKNHAFNDGSNKRAALLATGVFLTLNGWVVEATQAEMVAAMFAPADRTWSETDFADRLRLQTKTRSTAVS